ncbi:hypothetical protein O3M35_006679 [Rhynocoris fuscipes]|uniref:Uncharacterized protein n=1 Tax=Rhynocoris fuscipes TaxID=488301 RepID=A0AAW1DM05_9HEMI
MQSAMLRTSASHISHCNSDTSEGPVRSSRLASRVRAVPYPTPVAGGVYHSGTGVSPAGGSRQSTQTVTATGSSGTVVAGDTSDCRCRNSVTTAAEEAVTCDSANTVEQHNNTPMLFIPFSVPAPHHHLSIGNQAAVSPSPASTPIIKVNALLLNKTLTPA